MTVWRMQALCLSAVCFAAAAVCGFFSGQDLLNLLRGFTERHDVIASQHYALTGLLLTPMAVSIGLVFLFSRRATPEQMKNASKRTFKWGARYMIFLLASIVAALIAPIPQYLTVEYLALRRGYVACPTPDWPRHQPDRWALPGPHAATEHCPVRGVDPNT